MKAESYLAENDYLIFVTANPELFARVYEALSQVRCAILILDWRKITLRRGLIDFVIGPPTSGGRFSWRLRVLGDNRGIKTDLSSTVREWGM
jgi:hypothetical protein